MVRGSVRRPVRRRARAPTLSKLLLDTTFLIDAERTADALETAVDDDDDVAIAAITVAELRVGVLLATDRYRAARRTFLDDVLQALPVLGYDQAVAEVHAELLVHVRALGRPRGAHDLIIAATAKASGRTVVSADESAFVDLPGLQVRTRR